MPPQIVLSGAHPSSFFPHLEKLCQDLSRTVVHTPGPASAIHFLPLLRQFTLSDRREIENFLRVPEAKHVLVKNEMLKVVLIRWAPFEQCHLHGHAIGGCAFKVLCGQVEEERYSTENRQELLSKSAYYAGHIAYIDDIMGLHTVRNPRQEPAITLHAYTPGM